ncbi:TonB-dependent copper receptor [Pelistega sp. NLN82]|uniref:TonB-dependent copper receptor n=1 Tax=Pelistega ratti TaxID=2652177 RepID=A0A6L9Y597_9BURK|nr:TonB-dependent copper receptor [Pelistega ratti]NEN75652.1 TonB-dependent copper receptor [Pelistega ratti]
MRNTYWAYSLLVVAISSAYADDSTKTTVLDPIVIMGASQDSANTVRFNPKKTLQPLPAGDGADLLRSVPSMNIIRKGGSSGDPLFRGLGGSRLAIRADDHFLYGGCSGRMDPPTAYIFPNSFDEVIVTKGPQSVTQGSGLVTGSVSFVRKTPDFSEKNYYLEATGTLGSRDRRDVSVEGAIGNKYAYLRLNASHNESDDYRDGDGNRVHSNFKRDNQMIQLGLTPTENTELVATYERSRGEAAYADRMMDGSQFDRDAWNIRFTQRNITPWFSALELNYGQSEIDHVMDNYSLRTPPRKSNGMREIKAVNPKRKTNSGQLKMTFDWDNVNLQTGFDYMYDKHTNRAGNANFKRNPFLSRQKFNQWGVFAEVAWQRTEDQKWITGLRYDEIDARYYKPGNEDYRGVLPKYEKQTYHLTSGFIRWEQMVGDIHYYAGLGIAERSPDYWERNRAKTGYLRPEQNRQLDIGALWANDTTQANVSLFASDIKDFIMIDWMQEGKARNIDARRYGVEADVKWNFAPNWTVGSNIAYTYGRNRTDDRPLAQTPPLEWNNTLTWDNETYSVGLLWRVVAKQTRFAKGQGNIIGQDIGESAGFGVLSLNAGWKINQYATLQAGVDNIFDKTYAEFISKAANPSAGMQTLRVNEPGRTAWLRLQLSL